MSDFEHFNLYFAVTCGWVFLVHLDTKKGRFWWAGLELVMATIYCGVMIYWILKGWGLIG